jgi:hypothetical protein
MFQSSPVKQSKNSTKIRPGQLIDNRNLGGIAESLQGEYAAPLNVTGHGEFAGV